ncbi:MAG: hypothetical protein LC808_07810 [Actinobacteria bacterium]|nr:hypothetical protein [Actinomycetota bacterium]
MEATLQTRGRPILSHGRARQMVMADALVNVAGAILLWATSSTWASTFALDSTTSVRILGVLFLVIGIECALTARRDPMPRLWLWGLALVDAVFAVFAVTTALTAADADGWGRWVLAIVGDAALLAGVVKAYTASRLSKNVVDE